jgi:hypothetical protein
MQSFERTMAPLAPFFVFVPVGISCMISYLKYHHHLVNSMYKNIMIRSIIVLSQHEDLVCSLSYQENYYNFSFEFMTKVEAR